MNEFVGVDSQVIQRRKIIGYIERFGVGQLITTTEGRNRGQDMGRDPQDYVPEYKIAPTHFYPCARKHTGPKS